MTRDEMIHLLVLDRLEYRDDQARYLHLQKVLENGFCGFKSLTDKELVAEIRARGLNDAANDDIADDFDAESEADVDDHLFDSTLVAGHAFTIWTSGDYSQ